MLYIHFVCFLRRYRAGRYVTRDGKGNLGCGNQDGLALRLMPSGRLIIS